MKSKLLILVFLLLSPSSVFATRQMPDRIIYEGERAEIPAPFFFASPLQVYFLAKKKPDPFRAITTANARGHVATYEILEDKLYILGIENRREEIRRGSDDYSISTGEVELLQKIFENRVSKKNRVFADWYSGTIRIDRKPQIKTYQYMQTGEDFKVESFSEVLLLEIKHGEVVGKQAFGKDEYYNKSRLIANYHEIPKSEAESLAKYLSLPRSKKGREKSDLDALSRRQNQDSNFSIFLTRHYSQKVKIPLTKYVFINDASLNFRKSGAIIKSDIEFKKGTNLLFFEMGASNVPDGPWNDFTSGSVQLAIKVGDLSTKRVNFTNMDKDRVKFINNFGKFRDLSKTVTGELMVTNIGDSEIELSGKIVFTSNNPSTYQEILLENDRIPILSYDRYSKLKTSYEWSTGRRRAQ